MTRLVLQVSYDGRGTVGWQTQPGGIALQDKLEQALAAIAGEPIATICAGRTDAGVHAVTQVVHFDTGVSRPLEAWVRGVNSNLPPHLAVLAAQEVDESFHARFGATRRRYHYLVYRSRVRRPLLEGRATLVFRPLDVSAMRAAAHMLIGRHDFSAFRSAQCQAHTPVRNLIQVDFFEAGGLLAVEFVADAFLHHMIRNLMGLLLEVGGGRKPPDWTRDLLESRNRTLAPGTAPADGLYLSGVDYGGRLSLDTWPAQPAGLVWA